MQEVIYIYIYTRIFGRATRALDSLRQIHGCLVTTAAPQVNQQELFLSTGTFPPSKHPGCQVFACIKWGARFRTAYSFPRSYSQVNVLACRILAISTSSPHSTCNKFCHHFRIYYILSWTHVFNCSRLNTHLPMNLRGVIGLPAFSQ